MDEMLLADLEKKLVKPSKSLLSLSRGKAEAIAIFLLGVVASVVLYFT
jgi:hypothetical protein